MAEPRYAEALSALDALASVDLFRDFTVEKCREFLTIARPESHPAGALVIGQGERGDKFYIIQSGRGVGRQGRCAHHQPIARGTSSARRRW